MPEITTLVVDDEPRALSRMKALMKNFPEVEVIGYAEKSDQAIELAAEYQPDIMLLDVEMPNKTGLEVAEEIHKRCLDTQVIFVTSHDHYVIKAIRAQAFDYLMKPVGIDDLKEALERFKIKRNSKLSKREKEIVRLIAKGMGSKEIGEQLCISAHTVDTHRRTILYKTNCKNAAELTSYAFNNRLV